MPMFLPQPVFADAGAVVGLLVLIFTIVGWLVNLANSQNNPPAPPQNRPRPPRPRQDRVQNEIDIFLQEVRGERPADDDVVLEALPPEPRRRPAPPPPNVPVREPAAPRTPHRGRLGHMESHLDETLSSHHLESRMHEPRSPRETPHQVGEMAALQPRGTAKKTPLAIIQLLRDQQGVRQAMLVNEILSKPKSLRAE